MVPKVPWLSNEEEVRRPELIYYVALLACVWSLLDLEALRSVDGPFSAQLLFQFHGSDILALFGLGLEHDNSCLACNIIGGCTERPSSSFILGLLIVLGLA